MIAHGNIERRGDMGPKKTKKLGNTIRPDVQRVVIYARVSTGAQEQSGQSHGAQVQQCRDYVAGHHARLSKGAEVQVYLETASGSVEFGKRDIGRQVLESLREGDWLVVSKLDRAFRSAKDCLVVIEELKKRGIKLHLLDLALGGDGCVTNGINSLIVGIMSSVAQWERERIGERTRDVKHQQRLRGRYLGGRVPWTMVKSGNTVQEDPEKISALALMRRLRSQGVPLRTIQKKVQESSVTIGLKAIKKLTDDVVGGLGRTRGRRRAHSSATSPL